MMATKKTKAKPTPAKKQKRTTKLSHEKLESMFAAFCDNQNEQYVSKVCTVSRNSVRKYRAKLGWDKRLETIRKKAQSASDNEYEKRLGVSLQLLQQSKSVYGATLVRRAQCPECGHLMAVPNIKPKFIDIVAIIKAEQELMGEGGDALDAQKPRLIKSPIKPPRGKRSAF